jgi:glycosyltransferase involved in cell wall biosynthesis
MISIITICKNSSVTIKKTIESVLSQVCAGIIEYIIVDGASTDSTMDIVRSYGDRISKCISEHDEGIADAFNKGISLADGEIIGMINSDDILLPGTLAEVARYFSEHPEVEVIHADLLLYDGDHFLKRLKPPRYWWIPWRMILFNHPTTFVRRHVHDRYGFFDTSYRYSMDFELFLRWLKAGVTIKYIPEVFVQMQAGGASGRHIYEGFSENVRALTVHGFNPLLTYFQFFTKHLAQRLLDCKARCARGVRQV